MVNNDRRARYFYWTLFLGALVASIQHMILILHATSYELYLGESQIRTISYIMSGGLFLVIGAIMTERDKSLGHRKLFLFYFGLALIGLSYILSLTRGLYVYTIATLIIFPFILKKNLKIYKIICKSILIIIFAFFMLKLLSPNIQLGQILEEKFHRTFSADLSFEKRLLGAQTELDIWLNSLLRSCPLLSLK